MSASSSGSSGSSGSSRHSGGGNDGAPPVSLGEATKVWLRVGVLSFGGPAGQIALMHRMLVDERGWLGERQFLNALNYCMLLPGPEAQQLATYAGWRLHDIRGGLIAGTLFVLPGAMVLLALSTIYTLYGQTGLVAGLFYGVKAAVLTVVVEALARIWRRMLHSAAGVVVAALAFAAIFFLQAPFPLIVVAAGVFGYGAGRWRPGLLGGKSGDPDAGPAVGEGISWRRMAMLIAVFGLLWLAPLAALALLAPDGGGVFLAEGLFFSKMAVVTFGGAYAVLAYVAQQAVETYGWLAPGEMLDGLGLAETTPGPLILVLQFVGFLAAFREPMGLSPLLAGGLGAALTLWVTFLPCFLWIFLGAPYVERIGRSRALSGALAAITAAVVGVILNLAVWFSLHVLFERVGEVRFGPARLLVPELASLDYVALAMSVAAALALVRFHFSLPGVLGTAALAGLAALISGLAP